MTTRPTTRLDAAWVIAYDGNEHRVIRDASVVFEGDTVSYVGPRAEIAADEVRKLARHVIAPGFVSLHNHLAFGAVDRSFREDCRSTHFYGSTLFEYVLPLMTAASSDVLALTTRLSMSELMRSGVTTSLDVVDDPQLTLEAVTDVGLRVYIAEAFSSFRRVIRDGWRIEFELANDVSDERLLDQVLERALEISRDGGPLVDAVLSPAAVDTCRPELLARTARVARQHGLRMTTHCAQSLHEVHEIVRRNGKTPVELLDRSGFLGDDVILAHCIFIDRHSHVGPLGQGRDLELLGRSHTTVAHCPTQFARTGAALEDFMGYRAAGVRIGLSTDAPPQCMLNEMRTGAIVAKLVAGPAGPASARDLFDAATVDAADALGRPDLGRIAAGSKADFVVFRTDTPAMTPLRDPIKGIVYHASPHDIANVIVGGREVVNDGVVAGTNLAELTDRVQEACERALWPSIRARDLAGRSVGQLAPLSAQMWDNRETVGP